jgi:Cu2+-containing amine oxidase
MVNRNNFTKKNCDYVYINIYYTYLEAGGSELDINLTGVLKDKTTLTRKDYTKY